MNQFGHNFRLAIWGESHGHQIGISLDGVPAGIPLSEEDFAEDLARRRSGAPGTTPRREPDVPQIVSGVYDGYTTGAPLTIEFANTNTHSQDYSTVMRHYRPSHADLVAYHKFAGFNDPRGGGHFSARLTVALVAAGVVAKKMLPASIRFATRLTEIGGCTDPERFNEVLHAAAADRDSVGGIVECRVQGVPLGLGQPFFDSAESMIAHLLFAVPAVRGRIRQRIRRSASARLGEQRQLHRLRRHDGDQQRRGHQRRHHQRQRDRGARGAETHAEHRPRTDHLQPGDQQGRTAGNPRPPRRLRRPARRGGRRSRRGHRPGQLHPPMTRRGSIDALAARLTGLYDAREARSIALAAVAELSGLSPSALLTDPEAELAVEGLEESAARLAAGEPLQYVVGHTEFYGRRFAVREGVLIPRPETEELVDAILHGEREARRLLDVGTGSGCIAASLALGMPGTEVFAADISDDALTVAAENFNNSARRSRSAKPMP